MWKYSRLSLALYYQTLKPTSITLTNKLRFHCFVLDICLAGFENVGLYCFSSAFWLVFNVWVAPVSVSTLKSYVEKIAKVFHLSKKTFPPSFSFSYRESLWKVVVSSVSGELILWCVWFCHRSMGNGRRKISGIKKPFGQEVERILGLFPFQLQCCRKSLADWYWNVWKRLTLYGGRG